MNKAAIMFKIFFLTFVLGLVCGIIPIYLTKSPTLNDLSIYFGWNLIFSLILSSFNVILIILIYITIKLIDSDLSIKMYVLKNLYIEMIMLYCLYYLPIIFSIKIITNSWLQLIVPFVILYLIGILMINVHMRKK
jgi:hypothetical protein